MGILDWDESVRLAKGNHDLAVELWTILIQQIKSDYPEILRAHHNKNNERLQTLIHDLVASCCYCGVPYFRNIVKKIETQLKMDMSASILPEDMRELSEQITNLLSYVPPETELIN